MNTFNRLGGVLLVMALAIQAVTCRTLYSKYDYLHGKLTLLRTCYEVKYYDIDLQVDHENKFISGKNRIFFRTEKNFKTFQLDFATGMRIDSLLFEGVACKFKRDSGATFVTLNRTLKRGSFHAVVVYFSGHPREAVKAPWDGGFVWSKDSSSGKPWIGLACEGLGASAWLPCKDHWSDEADSMDMHLSVRDGLMGVSNGRLIDEVSNEKGWKTYHWQVRNPINNYDITVNAGDFVHFHDEYVSMAKPKPLQLDYYVLRSNLKNAEAHFMQVQTMLACNERYFGPYPFWNDGYKMVETPYWGMEHQSCVAYGNNYKNNKYGFDFIIIHESAHEWFANSITASDPADMWIHEGFTTYAEALYVEYTKGYPASIQYLKEQQKKIGNKQPMIGPRDVYFHSRLDNDIYYKGTWILHTMRGALDNDSLWFSALKGFYARFEKRIITTADVLNYFNEHTGRNWDHFFSQYLTTTLIPTLEYKVETDVDGTIIVRYRWANTVKDFDLPLKVTVTKGRWDMIVPEKGWQLLDLNYFDVADFKIKPDAYLMDVKLIKIKTATNND